MHDITTYIGYQVEEVVAELTEACKFFGVKQGRAIIILKLLQSFKSEKTHSEQQSLAYFEALGLNSLYRLWRKHASQCLELRNRLCCIFEEASPLSKDELDRGKIYKARSDTFVFTLAGRLMWGGIEVISVEEFQYHADGHFEQTENKQEQPDIRFLWYQQSVVVEGKRVRSPLQIEKRVKDAIDQIETKQQYGVVAIDYPPLLQLEQPIIERQLSEMPDGLAVNRLETELWIQKIRSLALQSDWVVGVIICTAYPVRTHVSLDFTRQDGQWSVVVIAREGIKGSEMLMRDIQFALVSTTFH
ncbi:MAG: hypothetical protein F4039_07765 [Gammaproteobacteria bacterium]|nr:hypothetical protein [Gammaproteobacteria bacterium]MYK43966.1 hypothetical protein [Gammaproteobacteria bacterium]